MEKHEGAFHEFLHKVRSFIETTNQREHPRSSLLKEEFFLWKWRDSIQLGVPLKNSRYQVPRQISPDLKIIVQLRDTILHRNQTSKFLSFFLLKGHNPNPKLMVRDRDGFVATKVLDLFFFNGTKVLDLPDE